MKGWLCSEVAGRTGTPQKHGWSARNWQLDQETSYKPFSRTNAMSHSSFLHLLLKNVRSVHTRTKNQAHPPLPHCMTKVFVNYKMRWASIGARSTSSVKMHPNCHQPLCLMMTCKQEQAHNEVNTCVCSYAVQISNLQVKNKTFLLLVGDKETGENVKQYN